MEQKEDYKKKFMDSMEQLLELQKLNERESRPNEKDEREKRLRELAYESLMEFKDLLKADGINIPDNLTIDDLRNNKDLYEMGIKKRQIGADEKSAAMLTGNLENILKNVPKDSLEELVFQKEFVENADKELTEKYKDVIGLYQEYFMLRKIIEKYKNGEELDPKKEEPHLYSAVAVAAAARIKANLKREGYSEEMQEIGANVAKLTAQAKYVNREFVLRSSEDMVKKAEKEFREYEEKKDEKIVDYAAKSLAKLVKNKDPKKFGLARELVYHVAKAA